MVDTPLLDLTQSLRVACSFAQEASTTPPCYVYVLGLPYPTNRISINSEEDVVNIRLLSICPPSALRPYFQEGYMAGTPDVTTNFDRKSELDFRNRLLAKFAIPSAKRFWNTGFERMPPEALFPTDDRVQELCKQIPRNMWSYLRESEHSGELIHEWGKAEERLLNEVRRITEQNLPLGKAINVLVERGRMPEYVAAELQQIRRVRNVAAHTPSKADTAEVVSALKQLRQLQRKLPGGAA